MSIISLCYLTIFIYTISVLMVKLFFCHFKKWTTSLSVVFFYFCSLFVGLFWLQCTKKWKITDVHAPSCSGIQRSDNGGQVSAGIPSGGGCSECPRKHRPPHCMSKWTGPSGDRAFTVRGLHQLGEPSRYGE